MLVDPGAVKLRVKATTYYVPKLGAPRVWLGATWACEHGKSKYHCKACGGGYRCEHGKFKYLCKDCGTGRCEHGKWKMACKDCSPSSFCEHGRLKRTCKPCSGASVCEHGRLKSACKECGGGSFCVHGNERHYCKECGGKGICEHGKKLYQCRDCGGNGICKHGREKSYCAECGGGGLCEHGRRRSNCFQCGGSSMCAHGRQLAVCRECLGPEKAVTMSTLCNGCGGVLGGKRLERNGGNGFCWRCHAKREADAAANGHEPPPKGQSWEALCITKLLPLVKYADGKPFSPDQLDQRAAGGLGTSKAVKRKRECDTTTVRYPDCLWVLRNHAAVPILVVVVEIDEHSHSGSYTPECESGKIDDTFEALQTLFAQMVPIVFVKMNPNNYDKQLVRLDNRIAATAALVNSYLQKSEEEIALFLQTHAPIVHVLYYHSKEGAHHLAHFAAKAPAAGWAYHVS